VRLYFFERIAGNDFVGPVIIAARDEAEAWATLARRERCPEPALREADWMIAQELWSMPATAAVVYPSHYRTVAVP